ncbi:MAG TPA: DUF1844 domain-containing protein, partial [Candidatus Limnocylindria bacterium]|nr:DUF1844 domain-containing protein [Candidatus Limnocylindria bacterium]
EEIMSALFGHMVIQNTNMALMFLGQVPHPQSGEVVQDLEAARMFIDQLEMLEAKTKGNLSREEEKILQQSLTHLRLTFVQAIDNPSKPEAAGKSEDISKPAAAATEPPLQPTASEKVLQAEESVAPESHKRYSKKF